MQVEYEIPSVLLPYVPPQPEPENSEGVVGEDEEEEEEEVEDAEDGEASKTKAKGKPTKRIIKARQSLAEKQPGTTIFPIARMKKIIKADKELDMMSNEAVFMVAVATEYFIKHFMEEGYTKARLDKRKIVNYKDMATVVERSPEFDFLRDVVPMPIPISQALEARHKKMLADEAPEDDEPSSGPIDLTGNDVLPPLAHSTNPLYPKAIVKKPPNTHQKGSSSKTTSAAATTSANIPVPPPVDTAGSTAAQSKAPVVNSPRVLTGKNAPTTPHALTTRSSRRSLAAAARPEVDQDVTMAEPNASQEPSATEAVVDPDRMEQD